jgi:AcrR family transcriptional regulator
MEAAEALFSRYGYARVSISQLLDASDLRAPSLYHHYGGKEKLYASWALKSLARMGASLRTIRPAESAEGLTSQIVHAIGTGKDVNLLHLASEMDLFEEPETKSLLMESLEGNVIQPIQHLLSLAGLNSSRESALLLAKMAMFLHPSYQALCENPNPHLIAQVAAQAFQERGASSRS